MPLTKTEKKLIEVYNPEAIEFLYNVMNDEDYDIEQRIEAARILASEATVPHPPEISDA
jgi:hypothetical protein